MARISTWALWTWLALVVASFVWSVVTTIVVLRAAGIGAVSFAIGPELVFLMAACIPAAILVPIRRVARRRAQAAPDRSRQLPS